MSEAITEMAELEPDEGTSKGSNNNNTPGCGDQEEPPPAKRPRTISELRDEVERSLRSGQSLTLQYEGTESLEEVLEQLFSEPVECAGNPNLEIMYQKLMSELRAAGLDSCGIEKSKNEIKESKGFRDSKELIDFLLEDEDTKGADKVDANGGQSGELDPRMIKRESRSQERQIKSEDNKFSVKTESATHIVVVRKEDGNAYNSGDDYKELFIDEGCSIEDNQGNEAQSSKKTTEYTDEDPVDEHLGVSLEEFISPKTATSQGTSGTNIDELIRELDPSAFHNFQLYQGDDFIDLLESDLPSQVEVQKENQNTRNNNRSVGVENLQALSHKKNSESDSVSNLSVIPSPAVPGPSRKEFDNESDFEMDRKLLKKHKINKKCVIRLTKLKSENINKSRRQSLSSESSVPTQKDEGPSDETDSKSQQEQVKKVDAVVPSRVKTPDPEIKMSSPVRSPSLTVSHKDPVRKPQSPLREEKRTSAVSQEKKKIITIDLSSSSDSDDEYVPLGPANPVKEVPAKIIKTSPEKSENKKIVDKPTTSVLSKKAQPLVVLSGTTGASKLEDKEVKAKTEQKLKHKSTTPTDPPKAVHCKSPVRSQVLKEEQSLLSTDSKKAESTQKHDDTSSTTESKSKSKKKIHETEKASTSLISPPRDTPGSPKDKVSPKKVVESPAASSTCSSSSEKGFVANERKTRGRPGRKSKTESIPMQNINTPTTATSLDDKESSTRSSSPDSVSSKGSSVSSIRIGRKKPKPIVSSESEADSADVEFKHPKTKRKSSGKTKVLPESNESLTDMMVSECFKTRPDFDLLIRIMNKTRPFRSKFLPDHDFDVGIALKKFPALGDYRIIKHEMDRLTEKKGPRMNRFNMETLERKLAEEMLNASNVKKRPGLERNEVWKLAIEMSKDPQKSPEEKKVLGMYCLCFHMIENDAQGSLFQIRRQNQRTKWKEMGFPTVDVQESEVFSVDADDMWIYAEGLQACKVPNFYEGILTCYAMHYVFDMTYHAKTHNFYTYFDNLIGFS